MGHTLSKHKKSLVFMKTGGRCYYCGIDLIEGRLTIDHVIPKSKGGHKTCSTNLVPSCRSCNEQKGNMSLEEYRRTLDRKTFYGERKKGLYA